MQTATGSEREASGQLNITTPLLLTGELAEERTRNICIQTSPAMPVQGVQERAAKLKSTNFVEILTLLVDTDFSESYRRIADVGQIWCHRTQVLHNVLDLRGRREDWVKAARVRYAAPPVVPLKLIGASLSRMISGPVQGPVG